MREILAARPRFRRNLKPALLMVVLCLFAGNSWACSVPVFRYALEHWRSDPYQVVFFHRGELTPAQDELLTRLANARTAGKLAANIEVVPVDLDRAKPDDPKSKDDLALWKDQKTEKLPWMVVKYPLSIRSPATIWAGEPTKETIDQLLDSPKRKEVTKRILAGDTAVWVLLESGNKEKDDKAYQRLKNELKRSQEELELPAPDPQDVADGLISVDQAALQIRFSIVRLSRGDAKEQPFIDMLLDSEEGLRDKEFDGQPMTFPVFGRGRALYAVIGDGINREVIFDVCRFLVGPCSCQVKNQNPGTDLLLAVNWEESITPQIAVDQSLPPLPVIEPVSTGNEKEPAAEVKTIKEPAAQSTEEKAAVDEPAATPGDEPASLATKSADDGAQITGSRVMTTTLICLAAAIAGIAVMSVFLMKS